MSFSTINLEEKEILSHKLTVEQVKQCSIATRQRVVEEYTQLQRVIDYIP
jgi:hypothetical protein